jgi:hypothetical protein
MGRTNTGKPEPKSSITGNLEAIHRGSQLQTNFQGSETMRDRGAPLPPSNSLVKFQQDRRILTAALSNRNRMGATHLHLKVPGEVNYHVLFSPIYSKYHHFDT